MEFLDDWMIRGLVGVALLLLGVLGAEGRRWWKLRRERAKANNGEAFESLEFTRVVLEERGGEHIVRFLPIGTKPLSECIANEGAREEFLERARVATATQPMVSMEGPMGSYLLSELAGVTHLVADTTSAQLDLWVMVPVVEEQAGGQLRTPSVLLVRKEDLPKFRHWAKVKDYRVIRGSHGAGILTLMHVAECYEKQQERIARARARSERVANKEEMWDLELRLDTETLDYASKRVPWQRFAETLDKLSFEVS